MRRPFFILDSSLAKCLDPDDLGVSPQRGTQGSHVEESRKRQKKRGVDLVIFMVVGKMRPCCGRGRVFLPSSSHPSFAKIHVDGPPVVLWGRGERAGP